MLGRQDGNSLIVALVLALVASSIVATTLGVTQSGINRASDVTQSIMAEEAARSGLQLGISIVRGREVRAALSLPYALIDTLHDTSVTPTTTIQGCTTTSLTSTVLDSANPRKIADVVISFQVEGKDDTNDQRDAIHKGFTHYVTGATPRGDRRDVYIRVTSFVPFRSAKNCISRTLEMQVTAQLVPSEVFNYAYFIANWGWFYGTNIVANGSVRSNGQFDFGGYAPTINGSPRYSGVDASGTLYGYIDDNNDGVKNGSDGGVYAGWGVINGANLQGMAATNVSGKGLVNQHSNFDSPNMPNLSDLTAYKNLAKNTDGSRKKSDGTTAPAGSIRLGATGTAIVTGVLGDTSGQPQNVYLIGTAAKPIVLDGPVVVNGNVIIAGYVTGQGSIYAGGSVYIANEILYVNAPATARPTDNSQATTQAWINAAAGKDALGLFAAKDIVVGDYTSSDFRSNVNGWLNDGLNVSDEKKLGLDGLPNTKNGRDGIAGTADDDVAENNSTWDVQYYTSADLAVGAIPTGKTVGDVIPGSGEDVDGDGKYTPGVQLSDFDQTTQPALVTANWAGMPAKDPANPATAYSYTDFATNNIFEVDGALYTNHAIAARVNNNAGSIVFNGAVVSRIESIIYSVPSGYNLVFNHDERLTANGAGRYGLYLPEAWAPIVQKWVVESTMAAGTQ